VVSDDVADDGDPVGTGMRTITVQGIADSVTFAEIEQTVTLNGVTPVALPIDMFRINRMFGASAGSTESNVGTITAEQAGTVISQINPTRGQTLQAIYTLPDRAGFNRCFIKRSEFSISKQQTVQGRVLLQVRNPGVNQCWRVLAIGGLNSVGTGWYEDTVSPPGIGPLPLGLDIRATVIECTTNNTGFSAAFDVLFVP